MTTLIVKVDDERIESLKKILSEIPYVHEVEVEETTSQLNDPQSTYERIKKIQEEIGDKKLFENIKDPSEWQREIRKEWDRDF
ncbi:hypothetical protein [Mucilaginibacter phyllosphaerae]|uniref:Nitrate reductase NapAB chaperone NapD n=1 Tax=Mucilaginibacter phyllosphaerae TaxID=1812349 RepID=A0A4Y8A9Z5_9SPHI|nr:hypothetical protein [Mucilaginibacter phyllosphaerae]MBB3970719.1 nitrate reductase NapAB chaperone NapD [Mucilaginibacter phyllosphaerae]TEW64717.1 hypothetical protein E2R65_17040 [Mucilaginibacter phyllosphaerae]GGH20482.1 hypothetical protein GCM10007352_32510 [Mucilaginibacter phyllosphaerae]